MKKRHLYAVLFAVPGFLVAGIVALLVFGGVMGILWLFVFGDDPWPASPDLVLSMLFVLVFLLVWICLMVTGYLMGKKLEDKPGLNWSHILLSGVITLLLVLLIVAQQRSVGNMGPKSDSLLCSDFCTQQGYSGSGMPPRNSGDRTCSCYDASGNAALRVPLDEIAPDRSGGVEK